MSNGCHSEFSYTVLYLYRDSTQLNFACSLQTWKTFFFSITELLPQEVLCILRFLGKQTHMGILRNRENCPRDCCPCMIIWRPNLGSETKEWRRSTPWHLSSMGTRWSTFLRNDHNVPWCELDLGENWTQFGWVCFYHFREWYWTCQRFPDFIVSFLSPSYREASPQPSPASCSTEIYFHKLPLHQAQVRSA